MGKAGLVQAAVQHVATSLALIIALILLACHHRPPSTYTVGGTVTGLPAGARVVLQDNGRDTLTVSANGAFTFATPLASGAAYAVTVLTQPAGATCGVAGGTGTMARAKVTSVAVTCQGRPATVGGTLAGLLPGTSLVLLDNGGDPLTLAANGPFTFAAPVAAGSAYAVTVSAQPLGQTCMVSGGSGTATGTNVTGVAVACTPNLYRVGGTLSGLKAGATLTLQDNGGDTTTLSADGPFTFAALVASGSAYAVTVLASPSGQGCAVAGGTGVVSGADVSSVAITCDTAGRFAAAAAVLLDGRVLIAGGSNGAVGVASAEIFDPAGNGGAGSFTQTGSMAESRYFPTATLLPGGKVLVAGGVGPAGELASAELFDPAADGGRGAFTATAQMGTPRYLSTATPLQDGRVLIAGGQIGTAFQASAELFDPAGNGGAGSFSATASMAAGRPGATATRLADGRVLIAGGGLNPIGAFLASAELFDPAGNGGAGSFAPTGGLAIARYYATATLLGNGKVLIAGGNVGAVTATAELFDPAANGGVGAFSSTGSMLAMRENATAVLLPSGQVQIAGGYDSARVLRSTELFDPGANGGAGGFSASADMSVARHYATASLLGNGQVLVAGGMDAAPAVVALWTAELFDPAANGGAGAFTPTADLIAP